MEKENAASGIGLVLTVLFLILFLSTAAFAADSHIEKGKKYIYQDFYSKDRKILVMSKPDKFGFVKVKFLSGYRQIPPDSEGFVNINNMFLAKETN